MCELEQCRSLICIACADANDSVFTVVFVNILVMCSYVGVTVCLLPHNFVCVLGSWCAALTFGLYVPVPMTLFLQ
jgi:hypothetical protein